MTDLIKVPPKRVSKTTKTMNWEIAFYRVYFHGCRGNSGMITLYRTKKMSDVVYLRFGINEKKNIVNLDEKTITLFYPWDMFTVVLDMVRTSSRLLVEWEMTDDDNPNEDNVWITTKPVQIGSNSVLKALNV